MIIDGRSFAIQPGGENDTAAAGGDIFGYAVKRLVNVWLLQFLLQFVGMKEDVVFKIAQTGPSHFLLISQKVAPGNG